jgi:hypothetical protein
VVTTAFLVISMTGLFFLAGRALWERTTGFGDSSWSCSYFLGMGLFLSVLRLVDSLTGRLSLSVAIAGAVLVIAAARALAAGALAAGARPRPRQVVVFLALWALMFLSCLAWWFDFSPDPNTGTHWGSIHSGRYVRIAQAFVAANRILRFQQNLGESALVASHLLVSRSSPYLVVTMHLSAGLVALGGAVLEWLRSFGVSAAFRRWGVVFVMLCNVSLSLTFINLVDCGSPLAIMGYVDTVFGVGSLVVLLLGLRRAWESRALDWRVAGVTALCGYAWSFTAPQNIVLCAGLAGLLVVWTVRVRDWGSFRTASVLGSVGLVAALAGALFGGMLMPKARLDPAASTNPDAMQTSGSASGLAFDPFIFFKASHYGMLRESYTLYAPASYREVITAARPQGTMEVFRSAMLRIEMQGWEALRILFFPVLGLLAGLALVSRLNGQTGAGISRVAVERDTFLVAAAWILLVPGVALAFLFSWNGFKHELNRFLYPGIVTAQTLLVVIAFRLSGAASPLRRRAILVASAVLGLLGVAGPVIEMAFLINQRFLTTPGLPTILRELTRRTVFPGA